MIAIGALTAFTAKTFNGFMVRFRNLEPKARLGLGLSPVVAGLACGVVAMMAPQVLFTNGNQVRVGVV